MYSIFRSGRSHSGRCSKSGLARARNNRIVIVHRPLDGFEELLCANATYFHSELAKLPEWLAKIVNDKCKCQIVPNRFSQNPNFFNNSKWRAELASATRTPAAR